MCLGSNACSPEFSTAGNSQQQSVVVEDNQPATCQLDDLLFELKAHKQDQNVNISVKILG